MNWKERLLLVIEILCLGHSLAQGPEAGWSVQCQPCRLSDQYVQCPGNQCPLSFQVDESSAPGACTLPAPAAAATTTAAAAASTADVAATTGADGSSSMDGRRNSTSPPETTPSLTTPATTNPTHDPNRNVTSEAANVTDDDHVTVNATSTPTTTTIITTTTPQRLTLCQVCLDNCRTCNGSGPGDCLECRKDHELRTSSDGLPRCVPTEKDSGLSVAIIAGASAGGGVVLLVLVVLVCVCCRRRARRRMQEQGPGMMIMDDIPPQQPAGKQEQAHKLEEDVQMRPTKHAMDVPEYVNVMSTMPRPISIERGHDKVTRYVRDPTVKKPEAALPPSEEQELAQLPAAPLPPPGPRKRSTDVSDPAHPHHPPYRAHTTPTTAIAAPIPDAATTARPDWRRRAGPHGTTTTVTSTSTPPAVHHGSDSHLPKFPIEEEQEKQEREASAGRVKLPRPTPVEEEELEDPEMDYENMGPKAQLRQKGEEGGQSSGGGVSNPGLKMEDEEPEDEYVNQAAILEANDDIDENPYQNYSRRAIR